MSGVGGHGHFGLAQSQADALEPGVATRWTLFMWLRLIAGFLPMIAAVVAALLL